MSEQSVIDTATGELIEQHVAGVAELNKALAKAQAEFPEIKREKTVKVKAKTKDGTPFEYSYSYAPLDSILSAIRKPLTDNGIALVQLLEGRDGVPAIRTELRHEAGGVVGSSLPLPGMPEKPQELGSMLTYFRRYAVMAILGIAPEEDDDGQAAQRSSGSTASANGEVKMSTPQRNKIYALIKDLDTLHAKPWAPHADWKAAIEARCHELYGKPMKELSKGEASQVIEAMTAHVKAVTDNPEQPQVEPGTPEPLIPADDSVPF